MKTKQRLKDFINKNGFFFHAVDVKQLKGAELNQYLGVEKNGITTSAERPAESADIMFFRGVATQQFGKGETNRNGYKIDVSAWDWTNYLKNPQILLSHDDTQPIGKTLEIIPYKDRIEILYYVELKAMNAEDAHRVRTNLFAGLSTGSLTIEAMYEDAETGERFTPEMLAEMPWSELERRNFIRAVTKAEPLEVSKVSLPSNPDALTLTDGIKKYFDRMEQEKGIFDKNRVRTEKNDATADEDEEDDEDEETKGDEIDGGVQDPEKPAETEQPKPAEEAPVDPVEGNEADAEDEEGKEEEKPDEAKDDEEKEDGEEDEENNGQEDEAGDGEDSGENAEGDESGDDPAKAGANPAGDGEPAANAEGDEAEDHEEEEPEGGEPSDKGGDEGKPEQNATVLANPQPQAQVVEETDVNKALKAAPKVLQDLVAELSKNLLIAQHQLDSVPIRKGRILTDQFRRFGKDGEEDKAPVSATRGRWSKNLARQVGHY